MKETKPVTSLSRDAQQVYLAYQKGLLWLMGGVWILIGIPSLWALRQDVARLMQYFTWTGLRFTLLYKPGWPSFGILFCVILTLYVLLSQSRYELLGLLDSERQLVEATARHLRRLPARHPLFYYFLGKSVGKSTPTPQPPSPKRLPKGSSPQEDRQNNNQSHSNEKD